jgi:phosphoribosylformylglycinamidine cyclo-ligase
LSDNRYKKSGVDVNAGYAAVNLMKKYVEGIGGFGGLYNLDLTGIKRPVLVAGTDGVGTKLKIAFLMNKHDTIGIDCVAMCVNDIICQGAKPLFFLDYIACGKLIPEKIAEIVKGVAEGAKASGAKLIGGETAEMPGFYSENEYDLAGFAVGIADKDKLIVPEKVKRGNYIIGIASSGVHSNGFSLIRKIFKSDEKLGQKYLTDKIPGLNASLGEMLLTPTKIYVKSILNLISRVNVNGICHVTGGGFYENIPRALPDGLRAKVKLNRMSVPFIFRVIMERGNVPLKEMYGAFNMGIGMVVIVDKKDAIRSIEILEENGENAYLIGIVADGKKGVELI